MGAGGAATHECDNPATQLARNAKDTLDCIRAGTNLPFSCGGESSRVWEKCAQEERVPSSVFMVLMLRFRV